MLLKQFKEFEISSKKLPEASRAILRTQPFHSLPFSALLWHSLPFCMLKSILQVFLAVFRAASASIKEAHEFGAEQTFENE